MFNPANKANFLFCVSNSAMTLVGFISSQQPGISHADLEAALPAFLEGKDIHLFWVDCSPQPDGVYRLTARLEINGQPLLLGSLLKEDGMLDDWNAEDEGLHSQIRLLALERILTDPDNAETLISL